MAEEEKEVKEAEVKAEEKEADQGAETAALRDRISELEEQVASLKDKALREAAENENYRRRLRSEKDNAVKFANEQLIRDLLDPLDNFSRAIEAAEKSNDTETIKTGVSMVENQIHSVLKTNWGLEPFDPAGQAFDPSTMEACSLKEEDGLDKDTVLQVFMKGYKLHDKVIRPAKVVVGRPKSH